MASTLIGGTATGIASGPWLSSSGDRQFPDSLFEAMINALGGGEGVIRDDGDNLGGEMAVTEASPAAMQVQIDEGAAILGPVDAGARICRFTSAQAVQISPADSTNARIDVVGLRIKDNSSTDANNGRAVEPDVITGTPAASPSVPTFTNTSSERFYPLCQVAVAANATSITNSNLTDLRNLVAGVSNKWSADTSFPGGVYSGDMHMFTDYVASGLNWKDTNGSDDLTSASQGDIAQFNGTDWVKQTYLRGEQGTIWTTGSSFPTSPGEGDLHLFTSSVSSGLTWKDTDGATDITSADNGDTARWNASNWVKQIRFDTKGPLLVRWYDRDRLGDDDNSVQSLTIDDDGTFWTAQDNTSGHNQLIGRNEDLEEDKSINVHSSSNNSLFAVTFYDNKLWALASEQDENQLQVPMLKAFSKSGSAAGGSFELHPNNSSPASVTYGDDKFWVGDLIDDIIYAYNASTGLPVPASHIDLGSRSLSAGHIAYYGGLIYVLSNVSTGAINVVDASDGSRQSSSDITLALSPSRGFAFWENRLIYGLNGKAFNLDGTRGVLS